MKLNQRQMPRFDEKIPDNLQDFQENQGKFKHFTTSQFEFCDAKIL